MRLTFSLDETGPSETTVVGAVPVEHRRIAFESRVVPVLVIYSTRCSIAVATWGDGVILKSLKREVKLNELDIFIAYPKLNRLYIQPIVTLRI